jgi:IclR family transcriptional regulator, pca regulon regulatory protein
MVSGNNFVRYVNRMSSSQPEQVPLSDQLDRNPLDGLTKGPNRVGGFLKGLAVIEAFDGGQSRLSISDVAKETGLDRAASRRLLLTLVSAGYAEFDGKFFQLAPRILRLGFAYLRSAPLPRFIQPYLEQVAKNTEESCSAAVLDGTDILFIARATKQRIVSINIGVGSRLPAYCSTMGHVLLAALPPEKAREILLASDRKPLTPKTVTDVDALMAEFARIKEQNYAIIDEEIEVGIRSVAVPVYNKRGEVVAALNVGAQTSRVSVEDLKNEFLPRLLKAQAELRQVIDIQ